MITLEKPKDKFLKFPEEVYDFFSKRNIVINLYPSDISSEQETEAISLNITSAEQYYSYLNNEINFWGDNDPDKKLETIACYSRFQSAKNSFDQSLNYLHSVSSMESCLNQSIRSISSGALCSKTMLAKELLNHTNKSSNFITGFKNGMLLNSTSTFSLNAEVLQGFFAAMAYRKVLGRYIQATRKSLEEFKGNVIEAKNNYASLNQEYTRAFLDQEKRLTAMEIQTNSHFDKLFEKEAIFFNDATTKLETLEKQYQENLKLKAPAQYWEELKDDYAKKGAFWLIISILIAIAIVILLGSILLFVPNVFSKDAHLLEYIKNSAILTVITSVSIYILRTTVKMAISSLHLSRDAKERKQLSVFYLSLIEDDAVTDKERAIILNALFSRADTGLLKGDASPAMSNNVSDLVEVFKSIK